MRLGELRLRAEILPRSRNRGYVAQRVRGPRQGRTGRELLLAALDAGVAGGGELVLELLDPAGRIDELQLARIEGMADVADIDLQFLARAARGELVAATAADLRLVIFGMDTVFHFLGRLRIN